MPRGRPLTLAERGAEILADWPDEPSDTLTEAAVRLWCAINTETENYV